MKPLYNLFTDTAVKRFHYHVTLTISIALILISAMIFSVLFMIQTQSERDELYGKFVKAIHEVQQKSNFKNLLLEKKLTALADTLEKKVIKTLIKHFLLEIESAYVWYFYSKNITEKHFQFRIQIFKIQFKVLDTNSLLPLLKGLSSQRRAAQYYIRLFVKQS